MEGSELLFSEESKVWTKRDVSVEKEELFYSKKKKKKVPILKGNKKVVI